MSAMKRLKGERIARLLRTDDPLDELDERLKRDPDPPTTTHCHNPDPGPGAPPMLKAATEAETSNGTHDESSAAPTKRRRLTGDPEFIALDAIVTALTSQPEAAQQRMLTYIYSRFGMPKQGGD